MTDHKFKELSCGFHSHLDASLDGGSTAYGKLINAGKLGRPADVVTDHGVMSGLMGHWMAAEKLIKDGKLPKGFRSIHGIEAYLIDELRGPKEFKNGKKENRYYHITIHFKTVEAYRYFCRLTPIMESRAIIKWGEAKPLMTMAELEAISGHITLGSGCLMGPVQQNVMRGRLDWAEQMYQRLRAIAGPGNWWCEIFPHHIDRNWQKPKYAEDRRTVLEPGKFVPISEPRDWEGPRPFQGCAGGFDIQKGPNEFILKMAVKYDDPIVVSLDDHYATEDDRVVQECLEAGTLVHTLSGFKKIENIQIGDCVLTHKGLFKKVLATRGLFTKSQKHFIKSSKSPQSEQGLILTENHLIYCKKNAGTKDVKPKKGEMGRRRVTELYSSPEWVPAKDVKPKDLIGLPLIKVPAPETSGEIDFSGFYHSSESNLPDAKTIQLSSILIDDDLAYFLGIFVGDGSATKHAKEIVQIISHWNLDGLDRVLAVFEKLGIGVVKLWNEHSRIWRLRISNHQFKRFLALNFYSNSEKEIPRHIWNMLSNRHRDLFMRGLYDADGIKKNNIKRIAMTSLSSIGMIAEWALSRGLTFKTRIWAAHHRRPHKKRFWFDSKKEVFEIYFNSESHKRLYELGVVRVIKSSVPNVQNTFICADEFLWFRVAENRKIETNRAVYDLEIDEDHSFVTHFCTVHNCRLGNGQESWKFYGSYAAHSSQHCYEELNKQLGIAPKQMEEWIDNSYKFVELFDKYTVETNKDRWLMPRSEQIYDMKGMSNKQKLWDLVKQKGRMPATDHPQYAEYLTRLKYEVSVLADNPKTDFLPYLFVLEDITSYAKSKGILWNVRGSAGGSLVLFLLGVSITDPIKYGLPFERFLTLGRIMSNDIPDIDSDWPDRDEIIQYIKLKYDNCVALIATDMMMRLKTSILDVERAMLGHVSSETAMMCRAIPGAPQGVTDIDWLFGYKDKTTGEHIAGFIEDPSDPAVRTLIAYKDKNPDLWAIVLKCIGLTKTRGVHAGGVIIAPSPVHDYVPIILTDHGPVTAYNMKGSEYAGLVKYDILGVSTLKAMEISLRSIKQVENVDIEWEEFPHDPKVYEEIIHKDKLAGIFQINTSVVKPGVLQTLPRSVKNISTLTALYRPGALDARSPNPKSDDKETAAEYFVRCVRGEARPYYIHPDLESILDESQGICIYQEQTLEIFRKIAGYSYEEAEGVRRAIGKKIKDLMEKHLGVLKERCLARGWSLEQATALENTLLASARYAFNKSHSASYAIVAYNGCWLKHHYPLHFWKGMLEISTSKHDKLKTYLGECRHLILPIDVVASHQTEWTIEGDKLRPPLILLKGCGGVGVLALLSFLSDPVAFDGRKLKEASDDEN